MCNYQPQKKHRYYTCIPVDNVKANIWTYLNLQTRRRPRSTAHNHVNCQSRPHGSDGCGTLDGDLRSPLFKGDVVVLSRAKRSIRRKVQHRCGARIHKERTHFTYGQAVPIATPLEKILQCTLGWVCMMRAGLRKHKKKKEVNQL